MNKIESSIKKINYLVENHNMYIFPVFVRELRMALGISRRVMSQDIDEMYMKITQIETGEGCSTVKYELVAKLSVYFGVPFEMLNHKADEYYPNRR